MTHHPDDDPVEYDGFGAPIYAHAIGVAPIDSPFGEGWKDLSYAVEIDEPTLATVESLRSWGTMTTTEISLKIEGDQMLETLALMTGYDFRLPLCEQQIPCKGQE